MPTAATTAVRSWDKLFIGGRWVDPTDPGALLRVVSPTTEKVIATVPDPQVADIDAAVAAAKSALESGVWRNASPMERADALDRIADAISEMSQEFYEAFSAEIGGPLAVGPFYERLTLEIWRDYAEQLRHYRFEEERRDGRVRIRKEPVGVVAALVPWNGVGPVAAWKLAAALAAGCSVVLKPAPEGPLIPYLIAEAIDKAGLPEGVVSILPSGLEAGQHLVAHPDVAAISFTGSTQAGKAIMKTAADNLTRVSLELGGKSAAIVAEDVDFAEIMPTIVPSWLGNCGQVCVALTRWLVPDARYDEFVAALEAHVAKLVIGDPFDSATDVGPLATAAHRERVERFIEMGKAEGAELIMGGGRPKGLETGWFLEPTIFGNVDNTMRIAREEAFGPVLCLIRYGTLEEAISIANDSDYGLAGGVFSNDQATIDKVVRDLQAGTITVNHGGSTCVTEPFGGFKNSGIGREGGVEGMEAFLELKTVNVLP